MEKTKKPGKIFPLDKDRTLPFILTGLIIIADQISKFIIVKNWPRPGTIIADIFHNDFFRIVHVRNPDIAFSLGRNMPESMAFLRPVLFIIIPLLVLAFLFWYYLKSDEFTRLQRWAAAGIIGGGLGNIIDRIFRPQGVVDFIDIKIYGLFGWERWPVFNIADSSVVVCCIILLLTILIVRKKPAAETAS
ncbi:MAG: signal peptidase II [Treponema sp.]|nr:signal peptidase II [Treponema sp.]